MQRVILIDLGENLPIQVAPLVQKLNSLQTHYAFQEGSSIPIARLGIPDYEAQWYYLDRLHEILRSLASASADCFVIGITHLRITARAGQEGDDGNRDYFSLSDFASVAVIGMNQNVLQFNSKTKNAYQYAAFSVAGELLSLNAKEDMYHTEVDHCLFDECVDRPSFQPAIEKSWICERCMATLKKSGVPQHAIDGTRTILDWCRKDIGQHSVLSKTMMSPLTTFLVGNVVGWVGSAFIEKANWQAVVIPSVASVIALYLYRLVQHRRRSSPSKGIQRTGA